MASKEVKYTPDGNWQVELVAFKIDLFFYKAIGSTLRVRHKEIVRSWFSGTNIDWVERPAESISVRNLYEGLLANLSPGAASRTCTAQNSPSCDCREWAVGIGISLNASADTGLPAPGSAHPTPGATLDIRSVRSSGTARIGNEIVQVGEVEAK